MLSAEQATRLEEVRRKWAPQDAVAEPREMDHREVRDSCLNVSSTRDDSGFMFYRCGGGRRIVKKKIVG